MSLHRNPTKYKSPFWYCSFRQSIGKDANGKTIWKAYFRSTKTTDRKKAEEIARSWGVAVNNGKDLTPAEADRIVNNTIDTIFLTATGRARPTRTVRDWCETWLQSQITRGTKTDSIERYRGILQRFYAFLKTRADDSIKSVTVTDVREFCEGLKKELSTASANLGVVTLHACLGAAQREQLIKDNPAALIQKFPKDFKTRRRPFTNEEVGLLLDAAGESEWRGLIAVGFYTGARLGDIARLRWNQINYQAKEITFFVGKKRGKRLVVGMDDRLADYLLTLSAPYDLTAFVFPRSAEAAKRSGTLSNRFYKLMVDAGLVEPRSRESTGKGRHAARTLSELGFHCFRKTNVSHVKRTGGNEAVAKAIVGHDSDAVSQVYTDIDTATQRKALAELPDIFTFAKQNGAA
jgi:integrase